MWLEFGQQIGSLIPSGVPEDFQEMRAGADSLLPSPPC